jgi:TolB-like protein
MPGDSGPYRFVMQVEQEPPDGDVAVRPTIGPVSATVLPIPSKPSIAVLPFENMSGDPEQEYLADGITEDLTTALSQFRWLL